MFSVYTRDLDIHLVQSAGLSLGDPGPRLLVRGSHAGPVLRIDRSLGSNLD
jgi:hypothetical protein